MLCYLELRRGLWATLFFLLLSFVFYSLLVSVRLKQDTEISLLDSVLTFARVVFKQGFKIMFLCEDDRSYSATTLLRCKHQIHFSFPFLHLLHLSLYFLLDHCVHYYDLRNTKQPIMVFKGHRKAVSYAKFVSGEEIVSASTDSQLKLWNVGKPYCLRSFKGHINEKNFVGLASNGDYIACGK